MKLAVDRSKDSNPTTIYMKTLRTLTFTFLLAFTAGGLTPAILHAQDDASQDSATQDGSPSFDYFYDNLQPYGQWIQVEGYGYCWQPNAGQDPNWQPYTDGYWAYTDAGWTWVSYEDFGWITYHYGRWTRVEDAGWVWVPDYQWAPAWVSWRQSHGDSGPDDSSYIGWAPLPPEASFAAGVGFSFSVDTDYDIGPRFYSFCRIRDFGSPVLGPVIIDRSRNVVIINNTVNITNITTNNNAVFVGGPSYRGIARRVDPAHPIQTLQLVRQTNAGAFRGGKGAMAHTQGNQLFVAAPMIIKPKQPYTPAKVGHVYDKPKIDRGWAGTNPQQKQQIQTVLKAQTKGVKPHQAARPVTAQQLSVIPQGNAPVTPKGPGNLPPVTNPEPANVSAATPPPNPSQPGKTPFEKKGRPPEPVTPPINPAIQQPANETAATPPPNPVKTGKTPFEKKGRPPGPVTPPVNPAIQQPANVTAPTPPAPPKPQQPANNAAAEQQRLLQQQKAAQAAEKQQQLEQQKAAQGAATQQQLEQQKAAQGAARQQQFEQQKAAAQAAAEARRQQMQQIQTPKPPQAQPPTAKASCSRSTPQPKPPGALPPARGGKPTPTPVP